MDDVRIDTPSSLDDFDTDESIASTPVQLPEKVPVGDEEDGWEDGLVLPIVDVAPDPIKLDTKDPIAKFLYKQPLENGVTKYVVQRGCTVEEKVYKPGDIIPVQCRFCVLWNREWLGKIRCHPGRILNNGTIMAADKFSCERYFICKEMESEFKTFLAFTRPTILMIKHLLPATRRMLDMERWAKRFLKRYRDVEPIEVFKVAREFLSSFNSLPQLDLIENFVEDYDALHAENEFKNKRKVGRPPHPHGQGDLVAWMEPEFRSVVKGVIVRRSRGVLIITCIDGPDHLLGQKLKFNYTEWRKTKKPTLLRKSVDSVVKKYT